MGNQVGVDLSPPSIESVETLVERARQTLTNPATPDVFTSSLRIWTYPRETASAAPNVLLDAQRSFVILLNHTDTVLKCDDTDKENLNSIVQLLRLQSEILSPRALDANAGRDREKSRKRRKSAEMRLEIFTWNGKFAPAEAKEQAAQDGQALEALVEKHGAHAVYHQLLSSAIVPVGNMVRSLGLPPSVADPLPEDTVIMRYGGRRRSQDEIGLRQAVIDAHLPASRDDLTGAASPTAAMDLSSPSSPRLVVSPRSALLLAHPLFQLFFASSGLYEMHRLTPRSPLKRTTSPATVSRGVSFGSLPPLAQVSEGTSSPTAPTLSPPDSSRSDATTPARVSPTQMNRDGSLQAPRGTDRSISLPPAADVNVPLKRRRSPANSTGESPTRTPPPAPRRSVSALHLTSPPPQIAVNDSHVDPNAPETSQTTDSESAAAKPPSTPRLGSSGHIGELPPRHGPSFKLSLEHINDDMRRSAPSEREEKQRKLAKFAPLCSQVTDYLFVSGEGPASNYNILRENGITHVVNCAALDCNIRHDHIEYLNFPLSDDTRADITCVFYEAIEFIEGAVGGGGKVLVHCMQGVSRSVTVVICYLIYKLGLDYEQAYDLVRAKRGIASPNTGFICQLLEWSKDRQRGFERAKMYTVMPLASGRDDLTVKMVDGISVSSLDPRGCYVIHHARWIKLWRGSLCPDRLVHAAERFVRRLMKLEPYANNAQVAVHMQGEERADFWQLLGGKGTIAPVRLYDEAFRQMGVTLPTADPVPSPRTPRRQRTPSMDLGLGPSGLFSNRRVRSPTMTHSTSHEHLNSVGSDDSDHSVELVPSHRSTDRSGGQGTDNSFGSVDEDSPPELYEWPSVELLTMFETDDLVDDGTFVLVAFQPPPPLSDAPINSTNHLYVWVGGAVEVPDDDVDAYGQRVAAEFLALGKLEDAATTAVFVMRQGDETDDFYELFTNG